MKDGALMYNRKKVSVAGHAILEKSLLGRVRNFYFGRGLYGRGGGGHLIL